MKQVESQTSGENRTKKRGGTLAQWVWELMPRSFLIIDRKSCFSWFLPPLLTPANTYFWEKGISQICGFPCLSVQVPEFCPPLSFITYLE